VEAHNLICCVDVVRGRGSDRPSVINEIWRDHLVRLGEMNRTANMGADDSSPIVGTAQAGAALVAVDDLRAVSGPMPSSPNRRLSKIGDSARGTMAA
jgi:hypothetical protein